MAIAIVVVVVFLLFTITARADQKAVERNDTGNLRAVYVAISQYEELNDQTPAPNLLCVRRDLGSDEVLLAANDPYAHSSAREFPVEPALPAWKPTSPVRLSFSYLWNFVAAGEVKVKSWVETRKDPRQGVLACPWYGSVSKGPGFAATADGPILRVNTDGSVLRLDHRSDLSRFTAADLFTNR